MEVRAKVDKEPLSMSPSWFGETVTGGVWSIAGPKQSGQHRRSSHRRHVATRPKSTVSKVGGWPTPGV